MNSDIIFNPNLETAMKNSQDIEKNHPIGLFRAKVKEIHVTETIEGYLIASMKFKLIDENISLELKRQFIQQKHHNHYESKYDAVHDLFEIIGMKSTTHKVAQSKFDFNKFNDELEECNGKELIILVCSAIEVKNELVRTYSKLDQAYYSNGLSVDDLRISQYQVHTMIKDAVSSVPNVFLSFRKFWKEQGKNPSDQIPKQNKNLSLLDLEFNNDYEKLKEKQSKRKKK